MTEVFLLDCFHFSESGRDFFSPEAQAEPRELASRLGKFDPDAVAVEAVAHQQPVIDRAYDAFHLEDLEDPQKMRTQALETIHVFGQDVPLRK